jgi:RHS repeat-associated protein
VLNIGQSGLQYRIVRLIGGDGQYRYIYDASGLRVAKGTFTGSFPAKNTVCPAAVPGTNVTLTAQYLLNLGGEQVTELNGTGGWVHSNVWAGSHLDATYDTKGLHFQLADPLGTRRVQTNYQGVVEEYVQSLPFGDNLNTVIPSGAPSTADDATEHHFTGKEHDQESGNDYFGARYYASAVGRWLSPDWSSKEEPVPYAKLDNPQTLNLYAYVGNNPLILFDDDGHEILYAAGVPQEVKDSVQAILNNPNTKSTLSGYAGKDNPNLTISMKDMNASGSGSQPSLGSGDGITIGGSQTTTEEQGSFGGAYHTDSVINDDGSTSSTTTITKASMTIDSDVSKGDLPGVVLHEAVHAGEFSANPAKYNKDSNQEHKDFPGPGAKGHDKRPQEERANGMQKQYGPEIKKAVQQMEKDRKKDQQ